MIGCASASERSDDGALAPLLLHLDDIVEEVTRVAQRGERRIGTEFDDRHEVAHAVFGERLDVAVLLRHDARRDRERRRLGQTVTSQQCVDQRPAHPTVAVGERVDRLELCVHHHRLDEDGHVGARHEVAQVVDRVRNPLDRRRDELGLRWTCRVAADPDGFVAPPPGEHGVRRDQQRPVDIEDRLRRDVVGEHDRRCRRIDVAHHVGDRATLIVARLGDQAGRARARRRSRSATTPTTRSERATTPTAPTRRRPAGRRPRWPSERLRTPAHTPTAASSPRLRSRGRPPSRSVDPVRIGGRPRPARSARSAARRSRAATRCGVACSTTPAQRNRSRSESRRTGAIVASSSRSQSKPRTTATGTRLVLPLTSSPAAASSSAVQISCTRNS